MFRFRFCLHDDFVYMTFKPVYYYFFFLEGSNLFVRGFAYIVPDVLVADTDLLLYRTALENDNGL